MQKIKPQTGRGRRETQRVFTTENAEEGKRLVKLQCFPIRYIRCHCGAMVTDLGVGGGCMPQMGKFWYGPCWTSEVKDECVLNILLPEMRYERSIS